MTAVLDSAALIASWADATACAVLGFALGLCVNGLVPQMHWVLWLMSRG